MDAQAEEITERIVPTGDTTKDVVLVRGKGRCIRVLRERKWGHGCLLTPGVPCKQSREHRAHRTGGTKTARREQENEHSSIRSVNDCADRREDGSEDSDDGDGNGGPFVHLLKEVDIRARRHVDWALAKPNTKCSTSREREKNRGNEQESAPQHVCP
jgi:hypothetical protein